MPKLKIQGQDGIFQHYQDAPLYANFLRPRFVDSATTAMLSDQGGGIHNGEIFEHQIQLQNSKLELVQTAAMLVLPSSRADFLSRFAEIRQHFVLENSQLFFKPRLQILTANSKLKTTTRLQVDRKSQLGYLEITATGRTASAEKWQHQALANCLEFWLEEKLLYRENWLQEPPFDHGPANFYGCSIFATGLFYGKMGFERGLALRELWLRGQNAVEAELAAIEEDCYLLRALDYEGLALNRFFP